MEERKRRRKDREKSKMVASWKKDFSHSIHADSVYMKPE